MSSDLQEVAAVGSVAGFDDYARTHGDWMLRVAWLVTRNHDDARDAVQDALIGLYRRWQKVPDEPARGAYVRRSVVNASIAILRRRRDWAVIDDPDRVRWRDPDGVPRLNADPAEAVTTADVVWRLCGMLTPDQRAAVVMRYFDQCDYAEIAATLGCRESTARSHIHRALARLRAILEEDPDGR